MGTPEFAVPSLEILIENKFNVVAVITAPDKPQGRGQKNQCQQHLLAERTFVTKGGANALARIKKCPPNTS